MMKEKIEKLLPGFNCGRCNCSDCVDFADALCCYKVDVFECPFSNQERYKENFKSIAKLLVGGLDENGKNKITGVIDKYEADIILKPLKLEASCREVLLPMALTDIYVGDIIEYRPLGCPVVHYGKVLEKDNLLLTVHLIGPCLRKQEEIKFKSVGCCMVIAFEGRYQGKSIKTGETVRFLPEHCMMQKVHSGVVVNLEGDKVRLEGIDLKVWQLPEVGELG